MRRLVPGASRPGGAVPDARSGTGAIDNRCAHRNGQGHAGCRKTRGNRAGRVPVAHRWIPPNDHQREGSVPLSRASSGRLRARNPGARIHHTARQGHQNRCRGDDRKNRDSEPRGRSGVGVRRGCTARGSKRARAASRRASAPTIFGAFRFADSACSTSSEPTPGVSATSPGSMTTNSVSVFGSGTNENAFLIDGTNFTCPCSGEARSEPGVDFIQEGESPVGGGVRRVRKHSRRL